MPTAAFKPAIPASERPQTHALDGAATAIDSIENTGLYLTQNFPDDPGIRITGDHCTCEAKDLVFFDEYNSVQLSKL